MEMGTPAGRACIALLIKLGYLLDVGVVISSLCRGCGLPVPNGLGLDGVIGAGGGFGARCGRSTRWLTH